MEVHSYFTSYFSFVYPRKSAQYYLRSFYAVYYLFSDKAIRRHNAGNKRHFRSAFFAYVIFYFCFCAVYVFVL